MINARHVLLSAAIAVCFATAATAQDTQEPRMESVSQIEGYSKSIKLPEIGMFIGTGVYPTCADYLTMSLYGHQLWVPQQFSPQEMIDLVISENQGNLVQFWGHARGHSPEIVGEWLFALDEIGIRAPAPDWVNGKHLTIHDSPELLEHADRLGAGALRFIREAAKKDIYTSLLYVTSKPQWAKQFEAVGGDHYLGYNFGEPGIPSSTGRRGQGANLQESARSMIAGMRQSLQERDGDGWGNTSATSGNPFNLDYEVLAGLDIPIPEDFAFPHLNVSSAISRGLYKQYDLPLWGSHLAFEHYSWIPYSNPHKFDLLRASMYLKYMAGSKMIINESGGWFIEGVLVEDSPMFNIPPVPLPNYSVHPLMDNPMLFQPFIAEARKHYDEINIKSPIAKSIRKEISDFYDFVKANGTPQGQPETTIGIIKGNLDIGGRWGASSNPASGSFEVAENTFFPMDERILAPNPNRFLSGTPHGQVDIVSFALDNITAEYLSANYKALVFAGWNTCSDKQYEILKEFVANGGTLFVGIAHLTTNDRSDRSASTMADLINGGDFSELCGVKVTGTTRGSAWSTAARGVTELGFKYPRRFGFMRGALGKIEITDPQVKVLVVDDEQGRPILLRRDYGKGHVYFLNSWSYPGAMNNDVGPGARLDSKGLIGAVYQTIAGKSRGHVWITDDREKPLAECEYISYSYFPADGKICLLNVDLEKPHTFFLHQAGNVESITLKPGEFRLIQGTKAVANQ